jgi:nucleoside-diphosphate-sugar epimerase
MLGIDLLVSECADRMRPAFSEVHRLVADSSKAALRLGWAPRNSFRQALEQTIEWYEAHEHSTAHAHTL